MMRNQMQPGLEIHLIFLLFVQYRFCSNEVFFVYQILVELEQIVRVFT